MNGRLAAGLILLAAGALALRLPHLDRRPLHTDESVQILIFKGLWETNTYRYNPDEFHGPSLHYFTYPFARLSGASQFRDLTETTFRLVPVLFGVGLIVLLFLTVDGQGPAGTIWAGIFTAVSTAMVFYHRYFIHESLLVFFTFLFLAAAWRYGRSGRLAWCVLSGVALGLMYATKETFVFNGFAAAVGLAITRWLDRAQATPDPTPRPAIAIRGAHLALAFLAGLAVSELLFSSFLANWRGPADSMRAFLSWFERARGESPHIHPWHYYLSLLLWKRHGRGPTWTEGLVVFLALVGWVAALARHSPRGASGSWLRFVGFYTLLLTLIYCAIPYKTPWCLLGFLHGLILLAGAGAATLIQLCRPWTLRMAAGAVLAVGAGQLALQAYRASYVYCDSQRNPYVYAHTLSDIFELVDKVERVAASAPKDEPLIIKVMAPGHDHWPLPWYLRRFRHVGYYGEVPEDTSAAMIIASPAFAEALRERVGSGLVAVGFFGLRPGVFLQLYVREDLWRAFLNRSGAQP